MADLRLCFRLSILLVFYAAAHFIIPELLIPEKSNVFYAMNNTGELNFVLRTKEEHEALQQKKKGRRKLKKLSI